MLVVSFKMLVVRLNHYSNRSASRGRFDKYRSLRKRFRRLLGFRRVADGDQDGSDQGHQQADFHGLLVSGLRRATAVQKAFHLQ